MEPQSNDVMYLRSGNASFYFFPSFSRFPINEVAVVAAVICWAANSKTDIQWLSSSVLQLAAQGFYVYVCSRDTHTTGASAFSFPKPGSRPPEPHSGIRGLPSQQSLCQSTLVPVVRYEIYGRGTHAAITEWMTSWPIAGSRLIDDEGMMGF